MRSAISQHSPSDPLAGCASPVSLRRPLVEAHDLTRRWGKGSNAQLGVDRVALTIERGELAAIVGPSGSGKSTLGALIAGIDRPTSGSLVVDGTRIDRLSDDRLARWRGRTVGIVFQDFHLLPTLTAAENVQLAMKLADRSVGRRERRDRARESLAAVGLDEKRTRLPGQLSGGEQQRVAIARAVVARPRVVVADEPTGSLDQASGHVVFDLLADLASAGTTVVFITHDRQLAAESDRLIEMLDGAVERHGTPGEVAAPDSAGDRSEQRANGLPAPTAIGDLVSGPTPTGSADSVSADPVSHGMIGAR